jgi:nucleosome binding factor SPN SPT16 subunit
VQFDETGNRRRRKIYGDEDELESEQEERRRRAALNQEFKAFSEKIADAVSFYNFRKHIDGLFD